MAENERIRYPQFESIAPTGTSYSSAVEVQPGRGLHVSGQLPVSRDGEAVGGTDMEAQATQVFENLKAICNEYDVGMDRIISMNYYCADLSRFDEVRLSPSQVLRFLPKVTLAPDQTWAARHGQRLELTLKVASPYLRACTEEDDLICVLKQVDTEVWQPKVVLPNPNDET